MIISYEYDELIARLKMELKAMKEFNKILQYFYVKRGEERYGYSPILDWRWEINEEFFIKTNVAEALKEMEDMNKII